MLDTEKLNTDTKLLVKQGEIEELRIKEKQLNEDLNKNM